MNFIPYRTKTHPRWLTYASRIPKLHFSSEEIDAAGIDRQRIETYVFSILVESWRTHQVGARVIAHPSSNHFWIEEISEKEIERKTITIGVQMTMAEIAQLPDVNATISTRARLALGWEPRQHGGIRAGGFEPGNELAKTQKPDHSRE